MKLNKKLGFFGESIAKRFLQNNGYDILETNYYSAFGEIDIIAIKNERISFIEVKTRSKNIDSAISSVSFSKQNKLHKTAQIYLSKNPNYSELFTSFDVIAIVTNNKVNHTIKHLIDAFRIF